jgi:hypothetical protein
MATYKTAKIGKGNLVHAVFASEQGENQNWRKDRAICGAGVTIHRSVGPKSRRDSNVKIAPAKVTCERCLEMIAENEQAKKQIETYIFNNAMFELLRAIGYVARKRELGF